MEYQKIKVQAFLSINWFTVKFAYLLKQPTLNYEDSSEVLA